MRNYARPGTAHTLMAPYTLKAGQFFTFAGEVFVATTDALVGSDVAALDRGVFDAPGVLVGADVYFNDIDGLNTQGQGVKIGVGVAAGKFRLGPVQPPRSAAGYGTSLADGLVATYRSRVIAAGDTLTDKELSALRAALGVLMASTAFAKLRELWVPMGTSALTGAMVKIVADASAGTSMTPVNLVAGDYAAATGITGNGTNKHVNTGFNPTTAAVQADGWGFGAFALNTSGNGALIGTITGANSYLMYASLSDSKLNNIQITGTPQYPRFSAVQANGSDVAVYHGGAKAAAAAYAAATVPNANLALLMANGANFSTQAVCGYAAWGVPLTGQELTDLAQFFDRINMALGRLAFKNAIATLGDSNTRGYVPPGGSAVSSRWGAQVAAALGVTDLNEGVDDSTMSDNVDPVGGAGGNWAISRKASRSVARAAGFLTLALGTNDARYGVRPENFEADYLEWVKYHFAAGFLPERTVLVTPVFATDAPTNRAYLAEYVGTVRKAAAAFGCGLADAYEATRAASGVFQSDNLHLNQAGHNLVAGLVLGAIRALG